MTNVLVKKQLDFIINNCNLKDKYEIDKIRYALEVMFYESIKLFTLICISIFLNMLLEFMLITFLMVCVRYCIGGGHAKSFHRCLTYTIIFYLIIFITHPMFPQLSYSYQVLILISQLAILTLVNPKHNRNRKLFSKKKKLLLKLISIIAIVSLFIILNISLNYHLVNCALLTLSFLSLNLLWEVIK